MGSGGQIFFDANGGVSAPGIALSDSHNTGIFKGGTESIGIAIAGVQFFNFGHAGTANRSLVPFTCDSRISSNSYYDTSDNNAQVGAVNRVIMSGVDTVLEQKRTFAWGTEQPVDVAAAVVSTHKLKVNINGAEYYILLEQV